MSVKGIGFIERFAVLSPESERSSFTAAQVQAAGLACGYTLIPRSIESS